MSQVQGRKPEFFYNLNGVCDYIVSVCFTVFPNYEDGLWKMY